MKYIIEFEDEPYMYEDEAKYYKCIQAPWWGLSERVIKRLTPYQPDHIADSDKKVSISCAHENDMISREAAIEALARMMPRSYTPDGSHPADEEIFRAQEVFADCIEALEILPSAQPEILACGEGELNAPDTNVGDMISRQTAIEALRECQTYLFDPHDPDEKISLESAEWAIKDLPPSAPSTAQTTETTAPTTDDWIPVERELPEDLAEVNVTWVNHEPEPYYEHIKSKPFTASAVYYEGKWYWYSSVCADVLAEYGRNDVDKVDDTIEITAWRPFPEPYRGGDSNE